MPRNTTCRATLKKGSPNNAILKKWLKTEKPVFNILSVFWIVFSNTEFSNYILITLNALYNRYKKEKSPSSAQ